MNARVLVVGDIATDILAVLATPLAVGSDTTAAVSQAGGGSAANTAVWLATTGSPVTLVGVVGTDAAGDARLAEFATAGVDAAVRRCPDAPTGTVVVLAEAHDRSMLCDRGANLHLGQSDVDAALAGAPDAGHLHLSGYTLFDPRSRPAGRHALAAATARGLTTSVDAASAAPLRRVGPAQFLSWVRGASALFANLYEARVLVGADLPPKELAEALAGATGTLAIVKLGADGAVWADAAHDTHIVPAVPTTVVDPTGAGDAFAAGVLHAWLGGATPTEALAAGTDLGARAVATLGGRPAR